MSTDNILVGTAQEPALTPGATSTPPRRWWRRGSLRLRIGLGIVAFFVLMAVVGPFFVGDPNAFHAAILQGPSARFPLGTTNTGQDVFAQLVYGSRGTLEVGFLAAAVATLISILIGIGGGYLGGRTDDALSLLSNVVLVIPALPLIILVSAYLHSKSLLPLIAVIAFTSWAASARVLRAQTLSVRQRDYVLAARASGEKSWRIVLVEILPNELPIVTAQFLFGVIFAILTAAGLAFLGLGNINSITWGSMLYYAQNDEALTVGAWWWFVPPGLCIAILGAGLALANFGLDEVSNPRLRVVSRRRAR